MDGEKHIYRSEASAANTQAPITASGKKENNTPKKEGKGGKNGKTTAAVVAVFLLSALALVGALQFTGILGGIFGALTPVEYYEYTVDDAQTLLRYLGHSALKSGDTLLLTSDMTVDVEQDLGGYAQLPLLNITGSGSVTFNGGTLLFLGGGGQDADMSAVKVNGCTVYIDAPESSVSWSGVADDSKVNCASLNGSAHTRELDLVAVGSVFEVEVTVKNESGSALENAAVLLSSPNYAFVDGSTLNVGSVAAGGTATATVRVIATEAGRGRIIATAYSEQGTCLLSGGSDYQTIAGAGYYAGDPHTHSTISEHYNTSSIADNIAAAWNVGMSWIGSVENCLNAQQFSAGQIEAITGEAGAFLQVVGVENGEGAGDHHLMAYGTDIIAESNYRVDPFNGNTWVVQDAVDVMVADGGRVILPHFFINYDIIESISLSRSVRDVGLMELFYGGLDVGSMEYKVGMNVWNNLNVRGRQRCFALGTANYRSAEYIGARYTKGYMTSLSESAFLTMLDSGNFFVTNGPELSFKLGSADMGGEIGVAMGSEGAQALCRISVSDDVPIETIVLYKYVVSGVIDNEIKEEAFSVDLTGQGKCSYQTSFLLPLDSEQECYYRLEVVTEKANTNSLGEDKGLAFSNPIWTVAGEKAGDGLFYSIEAKRGDLTMADNGTWVLSGVRKASANAIEVVADESAKVTVTYHDVDSEQFASYITVRVIAADGTIHTETIFVAAE
ncbi:MAG: hypothetical protein IJP01_02205 [Oscillospiraceae bacterium]|nr:hypothetical protein [Oscillospiraceae bacterium]